MQRLLVCLTIGLAGGGQSDVVRSCSEERKRSRCKKSGDLDGDLRDDTRECFCNKDYCNQASSIQGNFVFSTMIVMAVLSVLLRFVLN